MSHIAVQSSTHHWRPKISCFRPPVRPRGLGHYHSAPTRILLLPNHSGPARHNPRTCPPVSHRQVSKRALPCLPSKSCRSGYRLFTDPE
ncbi:hypothetical protein CCHR01_04478 [Colletotrichum chrysophilum]|uniref:Uncharacterized protein n=2 Tax=Colletotrichum gloeosporioides species complex TaxID=2707338 RepID=A0A8H3WQW9_9PEZI|nr:hypothetical protein GQ607_001483 [Colletotrichum asianum]KAH9234692.1 hypothetical protein K456DRAFT_1710628 [Colletotrichum gloeosporioides 23]KAK1852937.1 hypothetical protein CCHR01_04478 [Colletotrichum chrysophilum]